VSAEAAGARGIPTRLLGVGFLALVGVIAAEASQVVGALLLLGLLAAPAAAAHRLRRGPLAGIAVAGVLAVLAMWGGLVAAYLIPSLPPSTAVVSIAVGIYFVARVLA
jgi:zinc/manganese transport system permease protein